MNKDDLPFRPCVGIMVVNADGLVWVGRRAGAVGRRQETGDTRWQMPQGGIDAGEDPKLAALRELKEETGMHSVAVIGASAGSFDYELPPALIGKSWGGRYRGQRQRWYAVRFLGPDSEINIAPADGHAAEFDAWAWVKVDDVLGRIVSFKRDVYRAVLDELGHLAAPLSDRKQS